MDTLIGARPGPSRTTRASTPVTAFLMVGGVCGLAWAAGLRGLMAEVAGHESTVGWENTFVWVLAPGVVVGALLAWAEYLRRTGGRPRWRWLALSPLVLALFMPYQFTVHLIFESGTPSSFLTDWLESGGIGGGTIAFPLLAMAGGYAIAPRGPVWARVLCGALPLAPIVLWASMASATFGAGLAFTTPRGAWVTIFLASHLAVFAIASAIPHLPVVESAGVETEATVAGSAFPVS